MPLPKRVSGYSSLYSQLIHRFQASLDRGEEYLDIPFTDAAMAQKARRVFYSFRKALERDARSHVDKEKRKEYLQLFKVAEEMRVKYLAEEAKLRIVHAPSELNDLETAFGAAMEEGFNEAMQRVESKWAEVDAQESVSDDVLDKVLAGDGGTGDDPYDSSKELEDLLGL